ncbi:MAG: metalloregulator ArsR/SmtB family transcription factor [Candidatus Cloacimonetes bacterium]|nr:metalloregulator ArsR/SmtB family transcription factor [Candidatus Cloacimonadota bacterium]MDD4155153.1 metalloregulator ArsR/SmtB family transcription factor [Candidatus Cloacimonadota bacterium]
MIEKEIEVCQKKIVHQEIVNQVNQKMPDEELIKDIAEFFKILGEPTRIKIINILFLSEMCVCDISQIMGMNQSAISHQLKILKQANLVKYRKEGKSVFYSLTDEHIKQIFDQGMIHIKERYVK